MRRRWVVKVSHPDFLQVRRETVWATSKRQAEKLAKARVALSGYSASKLDAYDAREVV